MLVLSFVLLYQARITAMLNVFALQAIALSLVGRLAGAHPGRAASSGHRRRSRWWSRASSSPTALHRIVRRLGIHREIEEVIGAGPTMLIGLGLVALSILLVLPVGGTSACWRARISPLRSPSSCSGS